MRLYAPGTEVFKHMYGRRNDTESWHNDIKRLMKLNFPNTVLGQELFVITTGIAHKAVSHAQWRKDHGLPNALENTA